MQLKKTLWLSIALMAMLLLTPIFVHHTHGAPEEEAHHRASFYVKRGLSKFLEGDVEGALTDIETALEIDPEHAQAYYSRGGMRFEFGRFEQAQGNFKDAHTHYHAAAQTDLQKAKNLNPNVGK